MGILNLIKSQKQPHPVVIVQDVKLAAPQLGWQPVEGLVLHPIRRLPEDSYDRLRHARAPRDEKQIRRWTGGSLTELITWGWKSFPSAMENVLEGHKWLPFKLPLGTPK